MAKGETTTVETPKYDKPEAATFNLFGNTAKFDKDTNSWNIGYDNTLDATTMATAKKIRNDLLNSLGVGGIDTELAKSYSFGEKMPSTDELLSRYGLNTQPKSLDDLIGTYGLAGSQGTGLEDPYTKTYMSELLRLTRPETENALIGRGLGGSTVYKDALTDLITKAGTQAVLGGQQYKLNDLNALLGAQQSEQSAKINNLSSYLNALSGGQQYRINDLTAYLNSMGAGQNYNLNNLTALQNYLSGEYTKGSNLMNNATGYDLSTQGLAQQMYNTQLPYLATVNQNNSGLAGLLSGAASGAQAGSALGPWGTVGGAIAGGGLGYGTSQGNTSYPYLLLKAQQAQANQGSWLS